MQRRFFLGFFVWLGLAPRVRAAVLPPQPGQVLLAPWAGPHGGLPPFGRFQAADLAPALQQAITLYRAELAAITHNPQAPNFDNTVAALENAGRAYGRVLAMYYVHASTLNDAAMQQIERDSAPLLAAMDDEITHDAALFRRIQAVDAQRSSAGLSAEQQRLVWYYQRRHARNGAALDAASKARVAAINQRLAALYTSFSQHQLADEEQGRLVLQDAADLAGLPHSLRAAAAAAATQAGLPGRWLITNTRSAMEPFITFAHKRSLREQGWRLWTRRGDNGGATDNNAVIADILQLRAERARLFGHASHAHWVLDDNMAKTPDAAMALMLRVWAAARARVRVEVAELQALADAQAQVEAGGAAATAASAPGSPSTPAAAPKIEPWDYRYYAEKLRKARYDIDEEQIKPYLQLDKMREAMFWAAGQVFGLAFTRLADVPVCHSSVTVYRVQRGGQRIGLWYFDPFARPGKSSGAWMNAYRSQENFHGPVTPIVSNNANFSPGQPGAPVLISWDDAVTMFHEFGHALHGLLSRVRYPSLAGPMVLRDFGEFPSQLNEHWLPTRELLSRFALHHQTGQPMPAALVDKILRAKRFNQGFFTAEYLAAAIYDMQIHLASATLPADKRMDAGQFERLTMANIGCPSEVVMRHRPTHFGHIFSGEGYAAGYYNYLWADTLTADAAEAFSEAGGFYNKALARRLEASILRVGNTVPPDVAFRRFRGRDADVQALMRQRGFAPPLGG